MNILLSFTFSILKLLNGVWNILCFKTALCSQTINILSDSLFLDLILNIITVIIIIIMIQVVVLVLCKEQAHTTEQNKLRAIRL